MFKYLIASLSSLFLLEVSSSFSQTQKDSIVPSRPGKWGFEILVGINSSNILNKGYENKQRETDYGYSSSTVSLTNNIYPWGLIESDRNDELHKLLTIKIAWNYKHNQDFSTLLGIRYFYNTMSLYYTSIYSTKPSAKLDSRYSTYARSKTNNIQTIIGEQLNLNNFFFSASINPTFLILTQDKGSSSYSYTNGWYQDDDYYDPDKFKYQFCLGAGANIGYEFPIKRHAIKLELFCDYYTQVVTLSYPQKYWIHSLNSGALIGFKFGSKTNKPIETAESRENARVQQQKKKLSFEILAGMNSSKLLNKGYNEKYEYGTNEYSVSTLTFEPAVTVMPTIKFGVNYKFNKYVNSVCGLKYFYSKNSIEHTSMTYRSSDLNSYKYIHQKSKIFNFQFYVGPKGVFRNFYLSATINPTMLIINQESMGFSTSKTAGTWNSDGIYSPPPLKLQQLCVGAGANIGYELPLKWQTIKFELSCDYLSRKEKLYYFENYSFNSLNTSLLVGFKF